MSAAQFFIDMSMLKEPKKVQNFEEKGDHEEKPVIEGDTTTPKEKNFQKKMR